MIVVKVELWSAITGAKTELARLEICNTGEEPNPRFGDYECRTLRGRSTEQLNRRTTMKAAEIKHWPRLQLHVWNLVTEALKGMGYGR